jgi:hypothetical protein
MCAIVRAFLSIPPGLLHCSNPLGSNLTTGKPGFRAKQDKRASTTILEQYTHNTVGQIGIDSAEVGTGESAQTARPPALALAAPEQGKHYGPPSLVSVLSLPEDR